jgi:hypothetical protein
MKGKNGGPIMKESRFPSPKTNARYMDFEKRLVSLADVAALAENEFGCGC